MSPISCEAHVVFVVDVIEYIAMFCESYLIEPHNVQHDPHESHEDREVVGELRSVRLGKSFSRCWGR